MGVDGADDEEDGYDDEYWRIENVPFIFSHRKFQSKFFNPFLQIITFWSETSR